ncbi:head GIN domain-containing protein [Persicobacter sp. CCB-QB2]|uniref:head GIN domain-containing protein n=1 Tax=Persicobacter sp. CCB-QB2 TaxID=1561025 RepID=UPI0009E53F15|nr:head GIN domain-containing protein [Persicobacter sp. CCB-QB2]
MKKPAILTLLTTLLCLTFAFAQDKQTVEVGNFDEIHVGGAYEVYFTTGGECKVSMEGRSQDLERTNIYTKGNKLKVQMKSGTNNTKTIKVYIQAPKVSALHISGASKFYTKNSIKSEDVEVHVSGASTVKIELEGSHVNLHASGASNLMLVGKASTAEVHASGASNIKAQDFICEHVNTHLSGASNLSIHAEKSIEGKCSGAGNVRYAGSPSRVIVNTSGAGSVKKIR